MWCYCLFREKHVKTKSNKGVGQLDCHGYRQMKGWFRKKLWFSVGGEVKSWIKILNKKWCETRSNIPSSKIIIGVTGFQEGLLLTNNSPSQDKKVDKSQISSVRRRRANYRSASLLISSRWKFDPYKVWYKILVLISEAKKIQHSTTVQA